MEKPFPVQEVQKTIAKDFQIAAEFPEVYSLSELKIKLAGIISFLLDKDMNRLLAVFYRIDLNEHQVAAILTQTPVEEISMHLAELVLEREIEKVKTRSRYRDMGS